MIRPSFLSCTAPAKISEALALFLSINTINGKGVSTPSIVYVCDFPFLDSKLTIEPLVNI